MYIYTLCKALHYSNYVGEPRHFTTKDMIFAVATLKCAGVKFLLCSRDSDYDVLYRLRLFFTFTSLSVQFCNTTPVGIHHLHVMRG